MPNWEVTINYKDRGRPGSVKVLATDQPNEKAAIEVALDVAAENVPWDEVFGTSVIRLKPDLVAGPARRPYTQLTVEELAHLMYQSLKKDKWGDIAPQWFASVARNKYGDEMFSEARELRKVLNRVVRSLRKRFTLAH